MSDFKLINDMRQIRLNEGFLDWEWFDSPETVHLFIYLLLCAGDRERERFGETLKRGQMCTTLKEMARVTGYKITTIRTCFKRLMRTGEIDVDTTPRRTVVTIHRYDDFCSPEGEANDV